MKRTDFSFDLPEELIAQTPLQRRDGSRLLHLDKATGVMEHAHFYDLPRYLRPGDCLVLNDTKVIALTANAVVGAEEMYLNAGFDGYLSKPVTIDNFEKALKNYLPDYLISDSKRVVEKQEDPHSLDKMRALGLNVDAALGYAGGDEDFYLELLTDYANSAEEKCESLDSFLANNDLNNYEILIHSLKSTSRMVGADDLSDQARDLQDAAGKEEIEYVKDHHTVFVRDFKALAEKILN